MKPESLLKFGVYYNRNDPRVWVYRHDKYKAVGVTLNFAKTAAWVWLALLIGSLFGLLQVFSGNVPILSRI